MDKVIKVRRSFLNEIRGYCNRFVTMCGGCFKPYCDCALADEIHKAKNLIVVLDNIRDAEEERFYVENPYDELCDKIILAIRQGRGKPVSSDKIRIPNVYKQKKRRAILSLLKRGLIEMSVINGKKFYVVNGDDKKHNNNNNKKETHHGV